MKNRINFTNGLFVLLILSSLTTNKARAYLDPGSGSYLLQILLAGFFSALLFIKTFWRKIYYFLKKIFKKKVKNPPKDEKQKH